MYQSVWQEVYYFATCQASTSAVHAYVIIKPEKVAQRGPMKKENEGEADTRPSFIIWRVESENMVAMSR